jgi:hypothetical protein
MEKARGAGRWVWRVLAIGAIILPDAGGAQSWHRPPPILQDNSTGFHGLLSANSGAGTRRLIDASWQSAPKDSSSISWGAHCAWAKWSSLASTTRLAVWAQTLWAPDHTFGAGVGTWIRSTESFHLTRPLLQFQFSVPAGPAQLTATWQGTPEIRPTSGLQQTDLQRMTLAMARKEGDWTGRAWLSISGHGAMWSLQAIHKSSSKTSAPIAWSLGCLGPPWLLSVGAILSSDGGRFWPMQWAMNGNGDMEWTQGW